jgi:hypothetical protein
MNYGRRRAYRRGRRRDRRDRRRGRRIIYTHIVTINPTLAAAAGTS